MESFELENALFLLGATAVVVFLVGVMAATILRRARARTEPAKAPMPTPEFGAVKQSDVSPPKAARPPQPVAPPTRTAVPSPAPQQALQPSYTAIAVAQARGIPATRGPEPRPVVDYTDALTGVRPHASYTAAAIASLLGIAASEGATPTETHAGDSYAAIAARSATPHPRNELPPINRIDYSRELAQLQPNASYAAIAVAAAAQQR